MCVGAFDTPSLVILYRENDPFDFDSQDVPQPKPRQRKPSKPIRITSSSSSSSSSCSSSDVGSPFVKSVDDCAAHGPDEVVLDVGEGSSVVASSEDGSDIRSHSLTGNIGLPVMELSLQAGFSGGEMDSSLALSADYASTSQTARQSCSSEPVLTTSSVCSTSVATLQPGIQDRLPVIPFSASLCSPVVGTGSFTSPSQRPMGSFLSPSLLLTPKGKESMCSVPGSQHVKLSHVTMVTVTQVTRCISTEIVDRSGQVLEQSYVEVSTHTRVCKRVRERERGRERERERLQIVYSEQSLLA